MTRKPSVIMSVEDRKDAKTELKDEIKKNKELLKAANTDVKTGEKTLTQLRKNAKTYEDKLRGLEARLEMLKNTNQATPV